MAAPQIHRAALKFMPLPTGVVGIKALVELLLRDRWHQYLTVRFQVDPGTSVTSVPLSLGLKYGLPFSPTAIDSEVNTPAGKVRLPVHVGQLVVRVPSWTHRAFTWPCHFVDYPGEEPLPLLGLPGVLDDVFLFFDGTYAFEAPYGWIVLQERAVDGVTPAPPALPV